MSVIKSSRVVEVSEKLIKATIGQKMRGERASGMGIALFAVYLVLRHTGSDSNTHTRAYFADFVDTAGVFDANGPLAGKKTEEKDAIAGISDDFRKTAGRLETSKTEIKTMQGMSMTARRLNQIRTLQDGLRGDDKEVNAVRKLVTDAIYAARELVRLTDSDGELWFGEKHSIAIEEVCVTDRGSLRLPIPMDKDAGESEREYQIIPVTRMRQLGSLADAARNDWLREYDPETGKSRATKDRGTKATAQEKAQEQAGKVKAPVAKAVVRSGDSGIANHAHGLLRALDKMRADGETIEQVDNRTLDDHVVAQCFAVVDRLSKMLAELDRDQYDDTDGAKTREEMAGNAPVHNTDDTPPTIEETADDRDDADAIDAVVNG